MEEEAADKMDPNPNLINSPETSSPWFDLNLPAVIENEKDEIADDHGGSFHMRTIGLSNVSRESDDCHKILMIDPADVISAERVFDSHDNSQAGAKFCRSTSTMEEEADKMDPNPNLINSPPTSSPWFDLNLPAAIENEQDEITDDHGSLFHMRRIVHSNVSREYDDCHKRLMIDPADAINAERAFDYNSQAGKKFCTHISLRGKECGVVSGVDQEYNFSVPPINQHLMGQIMEIEGGLSDSLQPTAGQPSSSNAVKAASTVTGRAIHAVSSAFRRAVQAAPTVSTCTGRAVPSVSTLTTRAASSGSSHLTQVCPAGSIDTTQDCASVYNPAVHNAEVTPAQAKKNKSLQNQPSSIDAQGARGPPIRAHKVKGLPVQSSMSGKWISGKTVHDVQTDTGPHRLRSDQSNSGCATDSCSGPRPKAASVTKMTTTMIPKDNISRTNFAPTMATATDAQPDIVVHRSPSKQSNSVHATDSHSGLRPKAAPVRTMIPTTMIPKDEIPRPKAAPTTTMTTTTMIPKDETPRPKAAHTTTMTTTTMIPKDETPRPKVAHTTTMTATTKIAEDKHKRHMPSSANMQLQHPQPPIVHHIKHNVSDLFRDPPLLPLGQRCQLCRIDLAFSPTGTANHSNDPPVHAVLPCGHCFHDSCLEDIFGPPQPSQTPPCICCLESGDQRSC